MARSRAGQERAPSGGRHGRAVGSGKSFVHQGAPLAEFSGGLRTGIFDIRGPDVLGIISGLMLLAGAHLSSDFTPEAAEAETKNGEESGVEFS